METSDVPSSLDGCFRADLVRMPCTRSNDGSMCQILWRLEACNQLLDHIGYELREEEDDDVGDLRLAFTSRPSEGRPWPTAIGANVRIRAAFELFRCLCTEHRCVTLVELDYDVARHELLLSVMADGVGVKRIRAYDWLAIPRDKPSLFQVVLELVAPMKHVDELVFHKRYERSIDSVPSPTFSLTVAIGISLKKLDVADLALGDSDVSKLIELLMHSDTVTELAVGTSVCTFEGTEAAPGFADYLAKAKCTLRSLSLTSSGFRRAPNMERLVTTIAEMTALKELVVSMMPCGSEGSDILAEVLARSSSLRHLTVLLPPRRHLPLYYGDFDEQGNRFRSVTRWLTGIASATVLETLTLDVFGFLQHECRMLFLALSRNTSIRRMTVHGLLTWHCVEHSCRAIREYGLTERVVIEERSIHPSDMFMLPMCPEVKAVTVYASRTVCSSRDMYSNRFLTAWQVRALIGGLASCDHLTSLRLHLSDHSCSVLTPLASCLAGSNQLREVDIYFYLSPYNFANALRCSTGNALIKAVSSNPSLRKLTLCGVPLSDAGCRLLANAFLRSPSLHDLTLSATESSLFVGLIAPAVAGNYTVLNVRLTTTGSCQEEVKVVADVARRNRGLVARAARFVLDNNRSTCCSSAIEFVSRHPRLVETLHERAAVSEARAREMIRHALGSISGLDAYMVAAGVVKEKVECHRRRGGGAQLDQLHYDCWLHIRQYLTVADVLQVS